MGEEGEERRKGVGIKLEKPVSEMGAGR